MKRKLLCYALSLAMVFSAFTPGFTAQVNAAETAAYEYEEVSVKEPVSNSWHVTDGTSGDGPADWAFDNNSSTHWHSNYTATEGANKEGKELTWTSVGTIPAYSEVASSRAWIGAEFESAITVGKVEYTGRANKSANWYGQYALYLANVSNGEPKDSDFQLAASGTNTGFSKVTITLPTPMKATHFRLVAFTANPTGNNYVSASEIDVFEALNADTTPEFGGSIADTDTQWTDNRLSQAKRLNKKSETLYGWKNDTVISEIALYAANASYDDVKLTVGEFKDADGNALDAEAVFVRSTKAYNGGYLGYGDPNRQLPADNGSNRSESADIIWNADPVDMAANTVQPVWVEIDIPKDAKAGTYTGSVTAAAGPNELTFDYTVEVADAVLPDATEFADSFDIELWQYPYTSAEYYGVDAFSEEHFEIMESSMEIYKEIGGHAITTSIVEEAWSGQTYSKNAVHYPSMIKWNKAADGTFTWDYSDFDAWVTFCQEMGLGDKIVLYSIAPWNSSIGYWQNGKLTYQSFNLNNANDRAIWTTFLTDLINHLTEKGWFEESYLGIDERGFSATAFDLIDSVKNKDGVALKTAGAMDNFVNKWDLALRVTDLNVGDTAAAAHPEEFAELLAEREAKGYRTTLYSCTEHKPGNFSLSAPVESYWSILNAGMMETEGFLRWAYDAWVADPLNDTTHNAFEAGDCFLIFPDEKDAEDPQAYYSVRLARMAEGVRDVNKLMKMAEEFPVLRKKVDAVFGNIQYALTTSRSYLSDSEVAELVAETTQFKEDLNDLTEEYVLLNSGAEGVYVAEDIVDLEYKDEYQIEALLISSVENKDLTYTSSDEDIATVDENGLVTAVGLGETTIHVENEETGYQAGVVITVTTEVSIINKVPRYVLPEKYQSDVDGPYRESGAARRYLGQPDMVQTETGRLITVFPTGHGHGPLVMKVSDDNGETWVEKTDIPSSWAKSQETPTIYSLQVDDGKGGTFERLVLVCACPQWDLNLGGWQMSYSDDNGDTWTEFEDFWQTVDGNKHWTIVAMASLVQLKDENGNWKQEWMGVYHDYSYINYKSILTFDEDGNPQWSKPEKYLSDYRAIESSHQICEVGMFRSPDGERIVALGRNQTHSGPATMFYSDDEGKTWSEPVELPGSLAGERHKALYDPVSGKLLITFREIIYDRNGNGVWEGGSDWICGEWVAWVGDYEDLMNLQQGDYKLILDEDFSGNYYSGDTGYTGMAVLEDGTFVLHSYGHWDPASANNSDVRTDLCWIRQAKFNLAEIEEELEVGKVPADPSDDSKDYPVDKLTAISESQYTPGTANEGPDDYILDGKSNTHWHTNWSTDEATNVAKRWVGVSLDEAAAIDGIRYLPRSNGGNNGAVTEYKIQYRATDDGEWIDLATGTWAANDGMWKLVEFDTVVAKQVRVVGVHTYADSGNDAHMSAAEFRVTVSEEEPEVTPTPEVTEAPQPTETEAPKPTETEAPQPTETEAPQPTETEAPQPTETEAPQPSETPGTTEEVTTVFDDVYNDWYKEYVQYVYDNGLMTGIKGTKHFAPNANITKAQVAQVLYNMENQPGVTVDKVFDDLNDVYDAEWYADAVAWAYNTGVVTGDLNTKKFNPNADVTREQLALMMFRYAKYKEYDVTATSDYEGLVNADKVNNWAAQGMSWAVGAGLISGIEKDGVKDLAPQGNATRAQVAAILQRFCENVK